VKSWAQPPVDKVLKPSLLGQANIPKALHGINPRTIMGATEWTKIRVNAIAKSPYCKACGDPTRSLELHEDYVANYQHMVMQLREYVPLCSSCHSFIHSGLLRSLLLKREVSKYHTKRVLEHGLAVCRENGINVFHGGYILAKELNIDMSGIKSWAPKVSSEGWGQWRLLYNNEYYKGLTQKQWMNKYNA